MTDEKLTWLDPDQFFIPKKLKSYLAGQSSDVSSRSFSDISNYEITIIIFLYGFSNTFLLFYRMNEKKSLALKGRRKVYMYQKDVWSNFLEC